MSKLNGTASMFIARLPYRPLKKATFSIPEIRGNILNIFKNIIVWDKNNQISV